MLNLIYLCSFSLGRFEFCFENDFVVPVQQMFAIAASATKRKNANLLSLRIYVLKFIEVTIICNFTIYF